MRHALVLVWFALACGGDKTMDNSLAMETAFPCTNDCIADTDYTASVVVTREAEDEDVDVTCEVRAVHETVFVGPVGGPVDLGMLTVIDQRPLTAAMLAAAAEFQFRCTSEGGTIRVECSSARGLLPTVDQEIRCPSTEPMGPTCGVVIFTGRGDFTTSNFRTQAAITPANSADATAADALVAAVLAEAIPLGACGNTPTNPTFAAATDLGQSVEMRDGSTVLMTASKGTGNFYQGFGGSGTPPYGKALLMAHTGAGVTPAAIDAGTFPPALVVTQPAASPATITGGQDYTITWTPMPGFTSLVVSFAADMKTCRFDPAAGTGTIPGAVTSVLTDSAGMTITAMRAANSAASVGGSACVVKTVGATGSGFTIAKQ